MSGKCNKPECGAPDIPCHDNCENYKDCPNFLIDATYKNIKKEKPATKLKKSNLTWTGKALSMGEIHLVSSRTSVVMIGIVGKADAGKTTFLAMVYTLLLNGKALKDYDFAGTKTILDWDELHHQLKFKQGNVPFPSPTPVGSNRLFHFALKNKEEQLKDILFSDASGEVFSLWSINRDDENAESARWIYSNSNAFMLFIDCQALIDKQNSAKREIMRIAKALTHYLNDRPVIAIWSKSDKKGEINPSIKDSLKIELENLFANYHEIEISNFLEPGPDNLVHENNLAAIDWLLEKIMLPSNSDLTLAEISSSDLFINYKGK